MAEAGIALAARLPKPLLAIGAAALAVAVLHPLSREKILKIGAGALAGGAALFEAIRPMLEAHGVAEKAAPVGIDKAQATLASAVGDTLA